MNLLSHEDFKKTLKEYKKCQRQIVYSPETRDRPGNWLRKVRCVAVARDLIINETGAVNQRRLAELLRDHNDAADISTFREHSTIEDCRTWESCLKPLCDKTIILG